MDVSTSFWLCSLLAVVSMSVTMGCLWCCICAMAWIADCESVNLRRVLDIYCQIDSSQCLAQLTPARVGKARSVHVQLGASPHVIR